MVDLAGLSIKEKRGRVQRQGQHSQRKSAVRLESCRLATPPKVLWQVPADARAGAQPPAHEANRPPKLRLARKEPIPPFAILLIRAIPSPDDLTNPIK